MENNDKINHCDKCGDKINSISNLSKFKNVKISQSVKCKSCGFDNKIEHDDRLSKKLSKISNKQKMKGGNNNMYEVMKYEEKYCGLFSYKTWEFVDSFEDIESAKSYIKNEILEGDPPASYKIVKSIEFNVSID